ncbi:MAG: dihydrofolate reductase family protein, partial [Microbacterium sp.]
RRRVRLAAGKPSSPIKVTVTASGDLPPDSAFFAEGDVEKIVYCPEAGLGRIRLSLSGLATVVGLGATVTMADVLADLAERGVKRLMVEGGGKLHTQFLVDDLADELQLAVAPFFVGEAGAPRFVEAGPFPWTASRRANLADTRRIGDVVLLRYALSERFPAAARDPESIGELSARS